MAKAIMIQGTASGVGKTILTLALCRIFRQDGYSVSPFKALNLTTNTTLTEAGDEIAVSQYLQALAAGTKPTKDMNPFVIKPPSRTGKIVDASTIMAAYERLCEQHDIIVIEGAGSPVELNLNHNDMVNMGMARRAKSPVLLVSDIDRGGVFASLYGTINLMKDWEREYVKATVINRFRGDPALFYDGVKIVEDITKLPVAGVISHTEIDLPQEDGLFGDSNSFVTDTDYTAQFDHIAALVRKSLNMGLIYTILEGE
ncbi:MAG: AAA family ATPase [Defluviitaleaceae bacterium]|nr:AAA family ATPase [Defluviitaleaceae bacterium]